MWHLPIRLRMQFVSTMDNFPYCTKSCCFFSIMHRKSSNFKSLRSFLFDLNAKTKTCSVWMAHNAAFFWYGSWTPLTLTCVYTHGTIITRHCQFHATTLAPWNPFNRLPYVQTSTDWFCFRFTWLCSLSSSYSCLHPPALTLISSALRLRVFHFPLTINY